MKLRDSPWPGDQSWFGAVLVVSQLIIPVVIVVAIVQAIWAVVWAAYVARYGVGIPLEMFDSIPFSRRFKLVGRRDPSDLETLRLELQTINVAHAAMMNGAKSDGGATYAWSSGTDPYATQSGSAVAASVSDGVNGSGDPYAFPVVDSSSVSRRCSMPNCLAATVLSRLKVVLLLTCEWVCYAAWLCDCAGDVVT